MVNVAGVAALALALASPWNALAQTPQAFGSLADPRPGKPLPVSFLKATPPRLDNRNLFPFAKQQGGCGSCVVFAATGLLEGAIARDRLALPQAFSLSEQVTMDCVAPDYPSLCQTGSRPGDILSSMVRIGSTSSTDDPFVYTGRNGSFEACVYGLSHTTSREYAFRATSLLKIAAYDVASIKQVVFAYGAALATLVVTQTFGQHYFTDRVLKMQPCNNPDDCGGHAVVIVGWDDALQAFLVRNSWGPLHGRDGYLWISYDEVQRYSVSQLAYRDRGVWVIESL